MTAKPKPEPETRVKAGTGPGADLAAAPSMCKLLTIRNIQYVLEDLYSHHTIIINLNHNSNYYIYFCNEYNRKRGNTVIINNLRKCTSKHGL